MKRLLSQFGLAFGLAIGGLAGVHARTDCPAVPQPPTQEQLAEGFRNAQDRGAMWTLTKDGRTSYLYGTLHIGRMAWAFPGPKLMQALRESQALAIELDPTDPAVQAEMQAATAQAGKVALTEKDQARLDAQADAACLPREALRPLHPVMQAVTYTVMSGRRDGLDPAFGQEVTLIGFARAQQRPIISLETVASQLSAVLPPDDAAARLSFERALADLESGKAKGQLVRLSEAWARGDMSALDTLEKLCECQPTEDERAFARRVNDDRNPHLAKRIAEEHGKGRPVLAAVGLLHMTGPKAITTLLQQQGFEVKRVAY